MTGTQSELPESWAEAALEDIADVQLGKMLDRAKRKAGTHLPYLRNVNVRWGHFDLSDLLEMPFKDDELDRFEIKDGDVLVCEGGEPGRAAVWKNGDTSIKYQKALHRIRPCEGILPQWIVHSLYFDAQRGALDRRFTGTTIKHLTRQAICKYSLVVPPTEEQRRVLSVLDEHFSKLDAAVVGVERAQANLKRYRASVLQGAVQGRLVPTEAELAREEGREYESAKVLLDRILAERRRRWEEAELESLKAKGKPPTNDKWKSKYKEPATPSADGLPDLPEGWCWATVGQLGGVSGGLTKNAKRDQYPVKRPYLRVANVYASRLDLDEVHKIGLRESELPKVLLQAGDLLVVEGNGSVDQIGRVALWDASVPDCVHQNHLIKVRFSPTWLGGWVLSWMLSPAGRRHIVRVASSTSGLHTLSISKVGSLPVPLPPPVEQERILSSVDTMLSVAGESEKELNTSQIRCDRLRQAILGWAFAGKLVDHDPSDEPASELIERIRQAQASSANPRRSSGGRRRA